MISERSIRRVVERFCLSGGSTNGTSDAGAVQVLLDASASMAAGDGSKEQRAREIALVFLRMCVRSGERVAFWGVRGADRNRVIDSADADRVAQLPMDGTCTLLRAWPEGLAPGRVRVVVSDFLFAEDVEAVVRQASHGAARLFMVQVLDPWESDPKPADRTVLADIESDETLEFTLDPKVITAYRQHLRDLQQSYGRCCEATGATWVSLTSDVGLEQICEQRLLTAGILCEAPLTN